MIRRRRPSRWAWVEGLVVIALVLLAWRPRGGGLDPPAGQVDRPPPASPTLAPEDDD